MSIATTPTLTAFAPGQGTTHRGITVVPLFPSGDPVAEYITVAQAMPLGFTVTEVDEHGSVGELRVHNPTPHRVLMYDGEELEGAKQNRILNVSVLVEAGSTLAVPVSCVEAGRWRYDGDDESQRAFKISLRTSSPSVRRAKEQHLRSEPLMRGVAQSAVWSAVDDTHAERGSMSDTRAYADAVRHVQPDLDAIIAEFPLRPGQCGALLGYGGTVVCMDAVSRAEAYEGLHAPLLSGYVMDALSHLDGAGITDDQATAFVGDLAAATVTARPSAGLGTDVRLLGVSTVGSGLVLDDEVLQITAYRNHTDGMQPQVARAARIARPTRRR